MAEEKVKSPAVQADYPAAPPPISNARDKRRSLIEKLQAKRDGRLLIAYITSTRPNHEIQIADDVHRLLFDHLEANKKAAGNGIDMFLHSHGGSGTVPWRIVNLIREYTKSFSVLVPHRAFSAATLIAMGADEIIMHRMGCLGPIDPSVANVFNPPHPNNPGQLAPISVEDVTAYFRLVKDEVGIHHEDELVQAFIALTDKIHPLALGNVQRSHNQARMLARKLLRMHMLAESDEHEIDQIIDNLKSNLFYHGHPINRVEAGKDLALKVKTPTEDIEGLMWDLYVEYEKALVMNEPFNPMHELDVRGVGAVSPPVTTQAIIQQLIQMAQSGLPLGQGVPEESMVKLAVAMLPFVGGAQASSKIRVDGLRGAYLESAFLAHVFKTDLTVERTTINTPGGPQEGVKQEVLWQRWEEEK